MVKPLRPGSCNLATGAMTPHYHNAMQLWRPLCVSLAVSVVGCWRSPSLTLPDEYQDLTVLSKCQNFPSQEDIHEQAQERTD